MSTLALPVLSDLFYGHAIMNHQPVSAALEIVASDLRRSPAFYRLLRPSRNGFTHAIAHLTDPGDGQRILRRSR